MDYTVEIEYKAIRSMSLRVIDDQTVLVRANPRYTKDQILGFVRSKDEWIRKQLMRYAKEAQARKEGFYLLGKPYDIVTVLSNQAECQIDNNVIRISYTASMDPQKVLASFLGQLADELFHDRLNAMMACFPKLAKPKMTLKAMKSRWGSCRYLEQEIILNAHLIHVPVSCIDYVIAHELMHFYHPDHQKGFHDGMRYIMPDYRERRNQLRNYEFLLRG